MKLTILLLVSTAWLSASSHAERFKIEVKTRVSNVTEVKSRDGIPSGSPRQTVLQEMCRDAFKKIQHSHNGETVYNEKKQVEGPRSYVIEYGEEKEHWKNSILIRFAFECPSSPPMYIRVEKYDEKREEAELLAVMKDYTPLPDFTAITSYDIRIVTDVVEAYADQIEEETMTLQTSAIDVDEFEEKQRLRICQRATDTIAEFTPVYLETLPPTGKNKYYVLTDAPPSDENLSQKTKQAESHGHTITQAFKCPTHEELYVYFDNDDYKELALWIILKKKTGGPSVMFNILSYQLQFIPSFTKVSSTTDQSELLNDPNEIGPFPNNFDEIPDHNRDLLCRKSILATLGTKVKPLPETVPTRSELYRVGFGEEFPDGVMRAIKCEIRNGMNLYVSVDKNKPSAPITCWVIIEGDSEKLLKIVSPWGNGEIMHLDDQNASKNLTSSP